MELIFGGAYQGKTQYAAEKYNLKDEEIFTCEGLEFDRTARCIRISSASRKRARTKAWTRGRNLNGKTRALSA